MSWPLAEEGTKLIAALVAPSLERGLAGLPSEEGETARELRPGLSTIQGNDASMFTTTLKII
jgi:hypothetical protein